MPPGVYEVTFCVGYADPDSGAAASGAPTCQSYAIAWPPATPGESVTATITPTLGGGSL
jgi:hypothetical protein